MTDYHFVHLFVHPVDLIAEHQAVCAIGLSFFGMSNSLWPLSSNCPMFVFTTQPTSQTSMLPSMPSTEYSTPLSEQPSMLPSMQPSMQPSSRPSSPSRQPSTPANEVGKFWGFNDYDYCPTDCESGVNYVVATTIGEDGWSTDTGGVYVICPICSWYAGLHPTFGSYTGNYVFLSKTLPNHGAWDVRLTRTFHGLTPGSSYYVGFWQQQRDPGYMTTWSVSLGGTVVYSTLPESYPQYINSASVVATSSSLTLVFEATSTVNDYRSVWLNGVTLESNSPQITAIPTIAPVSQSRRLSIPSNAYLGCYVDATNGVRALPTQLYFNQPGYKACFALAQSQGYRYVGFQAWNQGFQSGANAGECWGGNDLASAEGQGVATNCALERSKDGSIMWGGGGLASIALYDLSLIVSSDTLQLPSGQPTSAPTNMASTAFKYLGCYGDSIYQLRTFPVFITSGGSYQSCFSQARLMGYRYVGLRNWYSWGSGECRGGNSLVFAEGQGVSSKCVQAATTDGNIMWGDTGGGNSIPAAVYDLTPNANPTSELTTRPPSMTGNSGVPVWCSWSFISCDPRTNAVVALDTTGSYSSWAHVTTIPSELGSLHSLQRLSLYSMGLSSTIPASIFTSLNQLTYLNLGNNKLTGTIPSIINVAFVPQKGALQLDLSYNHLTGTVPSAFTTLQYMYLGSSKVQWSTYWNCFLTSPVQSVSNSLSGQGRCSTPHSPGSDHYIPPIILLSCF